MLEPCSILADVVAKLVCLLLRPIVVLMLGTTIVCD